MENHQAGALTEDTLVISVRHQLSCELDAESVILNLKSGVYYGMSPVGARVWELLKQESSIAALRDSIMTEYDVQSEECLADLLALLRDLIGAGLVEVRDAA